MRSAFGVPMTIAQRAQQSALGPALRPRARMPYSRVVPSFGPGRSQFEHAPGQKPPFPDPLQLQLGIPSGGVDLRMTRRGFGAVTRTPANQGPGGNAALRAPTLPALPALFGPPQATDTAFDTALRQYAPLAAQILTQALADDPRTDFRVYQAKVKNLRATMRSLPPFLRPLFAQRLRVLEARLRAARERRALEIEAERATRTWRWVGWGAAGTGMVVGLSIAVLLLSGASTVSSHRRDRRERAA